MGNNMEEDDVIINPSTGDIDLAATFTKNSSSGSLDGIANLSLPSKKEQDTRVKLYGWSCWYCLRDIGFKNYKKEPDSSQECNRCHRARKDCES